jgi:hypothetical protein
MLDYNKSKLRAGLRCMMKKASKKCIEFGPFLEVEWPVVLPPLLPVQP